MASIIPETGKKATWLFGVTGQRLTFVLDGGMFDAVASRSIIAAHGEGFDAIDLTLFPVHILYYQIYAHDELSCESSVN